MYHFCGDPAISLKVDIIPHWQGNYKRNLAKIYSIPKEWRMGV
jgi:hypothetical protein